MEITDKGMQARPGAADVWLRRSLGRGCGVLEGRITPTGGRFFYFRYTAPNGNRERLLIGPYSPKGTDGGMTLADASRTAAQWSALYQSGTRDLREHFKQEKDTARAAAEAEARRREEVETAAALEQMRRLTVKQTFKQWQEVELAGRKDGGRYVELLFEARVFPVIGDAWIGSIRTPEAMQIIDQAKKDARLRTANVLLATMKQMFRFAQKRGLLDRNPLELIDRRDAGGKERERERFLSAEEVKKLAVAVPKANLDGRSAVAIWLILATGVRISEAMGARWADVDIAGRTWRLPETKNGRPHTVHLSDFAARQFEALQRLADESHARALETDPKAKPSPWVFPATRSEGPVDKTTFGKQLADRQRGERGKRTNRTAATTSLCLPGGRWTAHDLRRTAATIMAELGTPNDVIDECLNHKIENKVSRTYIQDRRWAEQARAFDALGARLCELVGNGG